jgi:hypothetical protein
VLKARLSLFLLVGALLGLFGQGLAYAAGPALAPVMEASHAMAPGMGCAGMMKTHKTTPEHPCKGLTLACIAQMGCVVPMTVVEPAPALVRAVTPQLAAIWAAPRALPGVEVAPEPEPPAA